MALTLRFQLSIGKTNLHFRASLCSSALQASWYPFNMSYGQMVNDAISGSGPVQLGPGGFPIMVAERGFVPRSMGGSGMTGSAWGSTPRQHVPPGRHRSAHDFP